MSKIIMMCGIPGSGKSTFCHKFLTDYTYISRDQIRFSLLDDADDYFAKEKEVMKKFLELTLEVLAEVRRVCGDDFIIDATHLTKSSRRKILSQLVLPPLYPINEVYCIYMKTDLKLALERNSKRTGRKLVPNNVIKNPIVAIAPRSFNFNDEIILTTCMGDDLILTSASNQMNIVVESVNFERLTLI